MRVAVRVHMQVIEVNRLGHVKLQVNENGKTQREQLHCKGSRYRRPRLAVLADLMQPGLDQ
jgi:hypothetical protein